MTTRHLFALAAVATVAVVITACGGAVPPVEEAPAPAEEEPVQEGAAAEPVEEEAVEEEAVAETEEAEEPAPVTPAEPQRLEFDTPDGVTLVGTFYPSTAPPAPMIILMHMAGATKEQWTGVALALQSGSIELAGVGRLAQAAASYPSYNVFAFDFRGHGESGGSMDDANLEGGWLLDALTALNFVRTLDGVDPDNIVMVGSSIGADAAADACAGFSPLGDLAQYAYLAEASASCVGAMAVSPGSFLGIPYPVAVAEMGGRPLYCMTTDGDSYSYETCGQGDQIASQAPSIVHETVVYSGDAHGTPIFSDCAGQTPPPRNLPPLPLLQDWLSRDVFGG
jgi:pimeloyl-ACP methyl ester carboxylesterase